MSTPFTVCDPLPIYRRGLLAALDEAGFEADDPADLEAWLKLPGPRGLLMTAHLPATTGVLREVSALRPDLTVVAMLEPPTIEAYRLALGAGASAAVPWDAPLRTVMGVVRAASRYQLVRPLGPLPAGLFHWEARLITSLTKGTAVADVARPFGCSEPEMRRILRDLYDRLGAWDTSDRRRTGTNG